MYAFETQAVNLIKVLYFTNQHFKVNTVAYGVILMVRKCKNQDQREVVLLQEPCQLYKVIFKDL